MTPDGWCCRSACPSPVGVPTLTPSRDQAEVCEACSGLDFSVLAMKY